MDTEISYRYKDKVDGSIKSGSLTLDRSIYKEFTDTYNTSSDDDINKLSRRLWNCHLVSSGNERCKEFLNDIVNFSQSDELRELYSFLKEQHMIELTFEMY